MLYRRVPRRTGRGVPFAVDDRTVPGARPPRPPRARQTPPAGAVVDLPAARTGGPGRGRRGGGGGGSSGLRRRRRPVRRRGVRRRGRSGGGRGLLAAVAPRANRNAKGDRRRLPGRAAAVLLRLWIRPQGLWGRSLSRMRPPDPERGRRCAAA